MRYFKSPVILVAAVLLLGFSGSLLWSDALGRAGMMSQEQAVALQERASREGTRSPGAEGNRAPVGRSAQAMEVVFFSDFEGSNGGLVGTRDWEWGAYAWVGAGDCSTPTAPPPAAYSGTGMWGTVLNDCHNGLGNNTGYADCNNTQPEDDSVLSLVVDLTGASSASLSWWEWFDLFLVWDWAQVYVNGEVVFQHCGGEYLAPSAWQQRVVDLSAYAGGSATIEFHMMASTVVNKSGWYLDDISVTAEVVQPTLALLETSLTAGSVQKALTELGRGFDLHQTVDFSGLDLTPYETVIVAMDGGLMEEPSIENLAGFARAGGNLVMLGGSYWANFAQAVNAHLLGIDEINYFWELGAGDPDLRVTQPSDPLARLLPASHDFSDSQATYYMIRSQDSAAVVAAVNGDGVPALLRKRIGRGTLSWFVNSPYDGYWSDSADYALLKQVIDNCLGLKRAGEMPWLVPLLLGD